MSKGHTRPSEARPPLLEELPDGRKRLTRFRTLSQGAKINDDLIQAWGTLDSAPATAAERTATFTNLRLVDQKSGEPGSVAGVDPKTPLWIEVYEELPATGEQQVGSDTKIELEDGRQAIVREYLQFSSDAFASVGPAGTAVGDHFLQKEEAKDDGALRRITRTLVEAGTIEQRDEELQGGKLLRRTIVSVKTVPATPSGYTLVGSPVQAPNGLPVYTYTFYKGDGQISQSDREENAGKLLRRVIRHLVGPGVANPIATPSTYTAVDASYEERDGHRLWTAEFAKGSGQISQDDDTLSGGKLLRRTIRHLVAPATANPIATPSGYTLVKAAYDERDGHRLWTAVFAQGAGRVLIDTETKNGGALTVTTVRYLGADDGSTPSGVLVSDRTEQQDGFSVTTKVYASGSGEISREIDYLQSSDQGTTGVTRTTIRHLTPTATTSDPTTLVGSVKVSESKSDQDGYRLWTIVYGKGTGTVVTEVQTRNGGKLVIYHRVALGAVPSAPSATISGTVTLIDDKLRKDAGYDIYDRTWAEGVGEIDRSTETRRGGMLQRVTIRHLTAIATGTQPTSDPLSGGTIVNEERADQDGYRVWSVTWVKVSTSSYIVDRQEKRNKGKLVIYRRSRFGSAPAAPSATISGTVVEIEADEELEDGFTVYSKMWAEGVGTIDDLKTLRNQGKLVIYRKRALAAAPSAPAATISGTVVLIEDNSREEQGVTVYDRTWAEGKGIIRERIVYPMVGLRRIERTIMGVEADADADTPTGVLLEKDYDEAEGVTLWHVAVMQKKDGSAIVDAAVALSWEDYVPFEYPGRAKYYSETVTLPLGLGTGTAHNVFLSPPVKALIEAEVQVTYKTANTVSLPATLWNPTESATLRAKYVATDFSNYHPKSKVQGLEGYNAVNSGSSGTIGAGDYLTSILGDRVAGGSTWAIALTGGPGDPAGNEFTVGKPIVVPAFVARDGTQWYQQIANYVAAVPAQAALPV